MNNAIVDGYFAEWLKDFIPRKDSPNDCEITEIKISYREVYYKYITKNNEEKENLLTIDLW